jgi:DNA polymerase-3 subunit delta'
MLWHDLRGHHDQVAMFRRAVQRGRMAHAYLFVGPAGVGKRLVARRIAQALLCGRHADAELDACGACSQCKQVLAGTHPDLLSVGLPEGKRELPVALFIGDGERRGREGLCHDLSLRPMSGDRRIAIIDDAERMNEESANALLKTLEEPPPGSVLFLISSSSDALLPTIRSRCQPLLFSALSDPDVAELVLQQEWEGDSAAAAEVARLSEGSLDTARQLLEPGLRQLRTDLHESLAARPFNAVEGASRALKAIEELGGGTSGQREHAAWLVRFAADDYRRSLHDEDRGQDFDRMGLAVDRCLAAGEQLEQSMPVPLCIEALFHDLSRIARGALVTV